MNTKSILFYWKKSQNALQSAHFLWSKGLFDDSISRSYYTILYAAKSVLMTHNVVTKTHYAVRKCFGLYLVKSGEIEKEWAAIITREFSFRTSADYEDHFFATDEIAEEMVLSAERFVQRMKVYLESKGVVLPDDSSSTNSINGKS